MVQCDVPSAVACRWLVYVEFLATLGRRLASLFSSFQHNCVCGTDAGKGFTTVRPHGRLDISHLGLASWQRGTRALP